MKTAEAKNGALDIVAASGDNNTGFFLTSLQQAAYEGNIGLLERLCINGENLFELCRDASGRTLAHLAVQSGQVNSLIILCDLAVELLHIPDKTGNTPLHYAVMLGAGECVKALLQS